MIVDYEIKNDYSLFQDPDLGGDYNICDQQDTQCQKNQDHNDFQVQLDEAIGISSLLREIIEYGFNLKSTIFSGIMCPAEKSLLYSIQALLQVNRPGVLLIVTPSHTFLKEKLWRINNKISWVAINNQVSQVQREKTLAHLESGGFKLIFLHPELLNNIVIHGVSMLILDEPQSYITKLPFENQMWAVDFDKVLQNLKPEAVQIMAPLCSVKEISNFISIMHHNLQFTFVSQIAQLQNKIIIKSPLTVSRDDELLQHLVQLLRSPRLFRKSGILIFCQNKYQIEESNTYLISKGLKCGFIQKSYQEQKKQTHFFDFAKGYIEILIVPTGLLFPQGFKHFINLTIHLYIPNCVETFLYDISEINPEGKLIYSKQLFLKGNSHVFLNAENYFKGRNKITSNFINPCQIEGLFKTFHPLNKSKPNDEVEQDQLKTQIQTHTINVNLLIQQVFHSQLQQKAAQLKLTKEVILEIIEMLIEEKWLQNYYLVPIELLIKLSNTADLENPIIKSILRYSKRCIQNNTTQSNQEKQYRCLLSLLQSDLNLTPKEIVMKLKDLSLRKQLTFSTCEENLNILVMMQDRDQSSKIKQIYHHFKHKIEFILENYDNLYKILQQSSFQTLDYMWRQVKLKQIDYNASFFTYLNHDNQKTINDIGANTLPFSIVQSQREKSNFIVDVQKIKDSYQQEQEITSGGMIDAESFASDCLIIFQGLDNSINNNFNNWKSSNLWKKYWKYQYESLYQIILDSYASLKSENSKIIRKKIKIIE